MNKQPETISLRSSRAFSASNVVIDDKAGAIRNAAIMTLGPADGHGFMIDGVMLSQVVDGIGKGVPVRFRHPEKILATGQIVATESLGTQVGRVVNQRIEGDQVRGDIEFGDYATALPGLGDVRTYLLKLAKEDPTAFGLSVAYKPARFQSQQNGPPIGRIDTVVAVDFTDFPAANPLGLLSSTTSAGDVPAEKQPPHTERSSPMEPTITAQPATPVAPAATVQTTEPTVTLSAGSATASTATVSMPEPNFVALEAKRVDEIKTLARVYGIKDDNFVAQQIALGSTAAAAAEALKEWMKQNAQPIQIKVGEDNNRKSLMEALPDAIRLRAGATRFVEFDGRGFATKKERQPHDRAYALADLTVLDMFRRYLVTLGCPTDDVYGLSRSATVELMGPRHFRRRFPTVALTQGTDDFDNILVDAANKSLRQEYAEAESTWQLWCGRTTAADFKNLNLIALSEAPNLSTRNEAGEIKYGILKDSKESVALTRYAAGIRLTYETIINDDLGAFNRIPRAMAMAAKRKEDDVAYAILTANANMSDGGALFNATAVTTSGGHANLASATGDVGAPTVTTLSYGRKLMKLQKGINSAARLNLRPRFLIVPAALQTTAEQIVSPNFNPTAQTSINPFVSSGNTPLTVVSEARLDDSSTTAWYLAADQNLVDTVVVVFLQDEQQPVVKQETDWDTEDQKYAVTHSVAAKAVDWRGLFKNNGA